MTLTDAHTHRRDGATPDAVVQIEPDEALPAAGRFSTGVHPWRSARAAELWPKVEAMAADSRIVAIGECGLDRRRGAPLPEQTELFLRHVRLAERLGKPLIVHCVGAWAELLALHRHARPRMPWMVHGFRGKPQLARQLLDAGMHISLGERFNPATAAIIPAGRLHIETDTSERPLAEIAAAVAAARAAVRAERESGARGGNKE